MKSLGLLISIFGFMLCSCGSSSSSSGELSLCNEFITEAHKIFTGDKSKSNAQKYTNTGMVCHADVGQFGYQMSFFDTEANAVAHEKALQKLNKELWDFKDTSADVKLNKSDIQSMRSRKAIERYKNIVFAYYDYLDGKPLQPDANMVALGRKFAKEKMNK